MSGTQIDDADGALEKTIRTYGLPAMRADKGRSRYFFFFLVAAAAWAACVLAMRC